MSHRVSAGPYTLELPPNGVSVLYEADAAGNDHQLPGGVGYLDALIQFAGEIIRLRAMLDTSLQASAGSLRSASENRLREALERIAILSADVGDDGWTIGAPKAYAHCARIARAALTEDDSSGRGLSPHFAEPPRSLPIEGNAAVHPKKTTP
ncbi:MAG: hypothetical protein KGJ90_00115 [Patescibacteria group bacterium]|nr:hypothetical protein [Patescibacteria group bacterium]